MPATVARSFVIAGLVLAGGAATAHASTPLGVWIDHTGRGAVEITECGNRLCGKIVWVKSKGHAEGCNIQVIGNARPVGGGKWDGGWILDPEENRKYDVELAPLGRDRLRVLGYLGMKMFGETMTWKRAPSDIERCDKPKAAAVQAAPVAPVDTPPPPRRSATTAPPVEASTRAPDVRSVPPPAPAAEQAAVTPAPARTASPAIVSQPPSAPSAASAPPAPVTQAKGPPSDETRPPVEATPAPPAVAAAPEPAEPAEPTRASRRGGPEKALVEALGSLFEEKDTKAGKRECKVRIPDFATLSFPC